MLSCDINNLNYIRALFKCSYHPKSRSEKKFLMNTISYAARSFESNQNVSEMFLFGEMKINEKKKH